MPVLLTHFMMQPEPTGTTPTTTPSTGGGGAKPQQDGLGGQIQMFLPFVLMAVVFYFLLLRPQQKKQRETERMLKALKKGDTVRTSGGIRGEITDLSDADVTVLIADKVKVNVLRSHIAHKVDANKVDASGAQGTKDKA